MYKNNLYSKTYILEKLYIWWKIMKTSYFFRNNVHK